MVLQKRLDYGFNGYQAPAVPRATRSSRRRGSIRKKSEGNQMCAFDLLATVAGKLLLEGETSPTAIKTSSGRDQCAIVNNDEKVHHEEKSIKLETFDQISCDKGDFLPEHGIQAQNQDLCLKDSPLHQNDACSGLASVVTTSGCSEKVNFAEKLLSCKTKNETGGFGCKVEVGFAGYGNSSNCKLGEETKRQIKVEPLKSAKVSIGTGADMSNSEDHIVWKGTPCAPVSSDSSAKVPLCNDHIPCGSSPPFGDNVKLFSRDDDENSSGCTHPSTTSKSFIRPPPRIGDRRIRKLLTSKYWKVAPRLKDKEVANTSGELKPIYRIRKTCYKRQRSQRNYPLKKRRLFSSMSNSGRGVSSGGISSSLEKGIIGGGFGLCSKMHGATGTSSSAKGQNSSFKSKDSHVKLRIKSFRVPELFIEMPETATVGSLKRRVMEAVTAILGGGLRVGVLLQGKRVRDDNKTLLQTGISHDNQLDALGFALEPNSSQAPPPLCTGDTPCLLPLDAPGPLTRYLPPCAVVHQGSSDVSPDPSMTNLVTYVESDHDSAPSPTVMSIEKSTTDSKALVPVPAMSVEAIDMSPMHRKSKRSDASHRRIRRPFSVSEVEALVQAVEKFGTGRWRDVKIRAFDNAKHRTYVDLKDKWKTLVHTARISPQQRRGEPVPQELLDRVLTAHSHWTQQAAKQQLKNQSETCLFF